MSEAWKHDDLAHDLAKHLLADGKRLAWLDIVMGPAGSPRPDVYTMDRHSWSKPRLVSYEVKTSISDFRSDVQEGKWQSYMPFSQAVVFAAPRGVIPKEEVPNGCGLMARGPHGWYTVRKPVMQQVPDLPWVVGVKLARHAAAEISHGGGVNGGWDTNMVPLRFVEQAEREARKRVGKEVSAEIAEILQDKEKARSDAALIVQRAEAEAAAIKKGASEIEDETRKMLEAFASVFGCKVPDTQWGVQSIRRAIEKASDSEVRDRALSAAEALRREAGSLERTAQGIERQVLPLMPDDTEEGVG